MAMYLPSYRDLVRSWDGGCCTGCRTRSHVLLSYQKKPARLHNSEFPEYQHTRHSLIPQDLFIMNNSSCAVKGSRLRPEPSRGHSHTETRLRSTQGQGSCQDACCHFWGVRSVEICRICDGNVTTKTRSTTRRRKQHALCALVRAEGTV